MSGGIMSGGDNVLDSAQLPSCNLTADENLHLCAKIQFYIFLTIGSKIKGKYALTFLRKIEFFVFCRNKIWKIKER